MLNKSSVTVLSTLLVAGMLALAVTPADAKNYDNHKVSKAEKKEFQHWLRAQNHDWRRWMYEQKYNWWKWVHEQKHLFYKDEWTPSAYTFPGSGGGETNPGDTETPPAGDPPAEETPKPRFEVLEAFQNAAVRDHETGLTWELAPSTATQNFASAWLGCASKIIAGRMGWRLPSSAELATLIDTLNTDANGLHMPADSPFTTVQGDTFYWTATEGRWPDMGVHTVHFVNAPYISTRDHNSISLRLHWWCVRGNVQGQMLTK